MIKTIKASNYWVLTRSSIKLLVLAFIVFFRSQQPYIKGVLFSFYRRGHWLRFRRRWNPFSPPSRVRKGCGGTSTQASPLTGSFPRVPRFRTESVTHSAGVIGLNKPQSWDHTCPSRGCEWSEGHRQAWALVSFVLSEYFCLLYHWLTCSP